MPKPNTRFLRHIIKDTDTHNKNLLAKEATESKARLRHLEHTEEVKRLRTNPNTRDIRNRQIGDIRAILGAGKKRRKGQDDDTPNLHLHSRKEEHGYSHGHGSRHSNKDTHKDQDLFRDHRDHPRRHGRLDMAHVTRTSRKDDETSPKSTRDRRSGPHEYDRPHSSRLKRHRSASPNNRTRSPSPSRRHNKHRHRSPLRDKRHHAKQAQKGSKRASVEELESDPLDDLFGPTPAPKLRGRGALSASSGIDRRFSDTYDPKTDIQMDETEGGGDWGDAVAAFRDRQKLNQDHNERMRSASLADTHINNVQDAREKSGEDVRWAKAGEKREWDRGKAGGVLTSLLGQDL